MAVSTLNITSGPFAGNDIADSFSFTFRAETILQLTIYETSDLGVVTELTPTTDFTVTGLGVDAGGVATRVAGPLPTGYTWYIRSNYVATQPTAFASQGGFFPDVHEAAFDKLSFLAQQLEDRVARSLSLGQFDPSVSTVSTDLPSVENRADRLLGFDSSGNLATSIPFDSIGGLLTAAANISDKAAFYGDYLAYGGTADAITLASTPPSGTVYGYVTGAQYRFRATSTNTGAVTVNLDGLGAVALKLSGGANLPAGTIRTDVDTLISYDGTNFSLFSSEDIVHAPNIGIVRSSVTDFVNLTGLSNNQAVFITDGNHGGPFVYDTSILKTAHNGGTIFDTDIDMTDWTYTSANAGFGVLRRQYSGAVNVKWFNAIGDGTTDDTIAVVNTLNSLADGDSLNLQGGEYNLFVGVAGVTTGDAAALSEVPRLFQKNNITIMNGKLVADSPSVSATKYRYPTTFTIDECSNITFRDVTFHSKGESWGDTDASSGLTSDERKEFAAQNGGHACLVVRSKDVTFTSSNFRLCGSVGAFYSMSSHNVRLFSCFSNCGSLGYAAYAFDSWAGDSTVSGFPRHYASLHGCSTSKEGYTYASKGCVITEDSDVTCEVHGGYFADASPNGASRDIGYAFGAASSQTIVNGATVDNCASVGYCSASSADYTILIINNVNATNLTKTVHQNADTSISRLYFRYSNCSFDVVGGGLWAGDGKLTRENTSYLALANAGNRVHGFFSSCSFTGATYGLITDTIMYGSIRLNRCSLETNGFLWNTQNIGSGSAGQKSVRGIIFTDCDIVDISAETGAYSVLSSVNTYSYIDLSSSTITLNSAREVETSSIASSATYVQKYEFPRDDANIETIATTKVLKPDSSKIQVLTPSAATRAVNLPRYDKYKFMEFKLVNSGGTFDLIIRDYTNTVSYLTLTPGQTAIAWNDGVTDYVKLL